MQGMGKRRNRAFPWVPKNLPGNWPYTPHRDGWCRWYKGQSRHICGKTTPIDDVDERWVEKKKQIDAELRNRKLRASASKTVREGASAYYEFLDYRVKTGKPEPLSPATAADYKRIINEFGRGIGPDRPLEDL